MPATFSGSSTGAGDVYVNRTLGFGRASPTHWKLAAGVPLTLIGVANGTCRSAIRPMMVKGATCRTNAGTFNSTPSTWPRPTTEHDRRRRSKVIRGERMPNARCSRQATGCQLGCT
jgi:hypothetical protein